VGDVMWSNTASRTAGALSARARSTMLTIWSASGSGSGSGSSTSSTSSCLTVQTKRSVLSTGR
jgi:hypothetical protein